MFFASYMEGFLTFIIPITISSANVDAIPLQKALWAIYERTGGLLMPRTLFIKVQFHPEKLSL